ncbi:hypothetical protein KAH55_01760, partial [bacterium]|nr:hypothetical protein [bacterium]
RGLIKRAYTMDTWDFDYVSQDQNKLNFRITDDTHWGIFHGDNSGFYEAFLLMSALYKNLENSFKADYWQEWADRFRERTNKICWNGQFYKHRVALDDFTIPGVNEAAQLSFSNPMAINRGLTDHKMAVAMLQEYQARKQKSNAFAGWFSMDPAFPDGSFGDPKLVAGAYINGGIMPLVGGELARAAFEHGFEKYGHQILTQYAEIIKESGETYLWYFPDGKASSVETSTSPDATPTDGWGSSAMLYGYVEGLAGVVDRGACFRDVRCSPRWAAADVKTAEVKLRYPASMTSFDYDYTQLENSCSVEIHAYSHVQLHLLLPENKNVTEVQVDGQTCRFDTSRVETSQYLDVDLDVPGTAKVEVNFS